MVNHSDIPAYKGENGQLCRQLIVVTGEVEFSSTVYVC